MSNKVAYGKEWLLVTASYYSLQWHDPVQFFPKVLPHCIYGIKEFTS